MVRVGEETGRLEDMLLQVAAALETDTRKLVKRLIALAEPCIILIMGLVVGFIVVAMLMAILSVTDISAMRRLLRDQRGFSLIELLVVIIILGLIAGLVGPRLFRPRGAEQAGRRPRADRAVRRGPRPVSPGHRRLPARGAGLQALVKNPNVSNWNGHISRSRGAGGSWGRAYQYKCCPGDHGDYDIWSLGADGAPGGDGENGDVASWDVK